ncbi:MAG: hypothetical protein ACOC33_01250 [bacterium]
MPYTQGNNKSFAQLNVDINRVYDENKRNANDKVRIGQLFGDITDSIFTKILNHFDAPTGFTITESATTELNCNNYFFPNFSITGSSLTSTTFQLSNVQDLCYGKIKYVKNTSNDVEIKLTGDTIHKASFNINTANTFTISGSSGTTFVFDFYKNNNLFWNYKSYNEV